jgi:hypothetical protein
MERVRKRRPSNYRPLDRGTRHKAMIDKLKPMSDTRLQRGQIELINVFGMNSEDYAISFQTNKGTLTWFSDRGDLHRLGRVLLDL